MVASTHRLHIVDGVVEKHYRSWEQGEPEREWDTLVLLDRVLPDFAPRPIERRWDDGGPVVVMTRVPGTPLGDRPLAAVQVAAVADALTRLHGLGVASLDGVPARNLGCEEMLERVRAWSAGIGYDGASARVVEALTAGREWLVERAAAELEPEHPCPVLTNADGNLGNYLWDGRRCRVVDFEDAGLSELGYEVADLLEHLSVSLGCQIEPESFMARLGLDGAGRVHVRRCRRLFAIFWLLMLLPGNPAHARNPVGSLERQARRTLDLLGGRT